MKNQPQFNAFDKVRLKNQIVVDNVLLPVGTSGTVSQVYYDHGGYGVEFKISSEKNISAYCGGELLEKE